MSDKCGLLLPSVRCLTKEQAAAYLGIGVTLLLQLGPPPIKFGRRSVWDVVDLDRWLSTIRTEGGPERSFNGPHEKDRPAGPLLRMACRTAIATTVGRQVTE